MGSGATTLQICVFLCLDSCLQKRQPLTNSVRRSDPDAADRTGEKHKASEPVLADHTKPRSNSPRRTPFHAKILMSRLRSGLRTIWRDSAAVFVQLDCRPLMKLQGRQQVAPTALRETHRSPTLHNAGSGTTQLIGHHDTGVPFHPADSRSHERRIAKSFLEGPFGETYNRWKIEVTEV